jgi:hypothetical protein
LQRQQDLLELVAVSLVPTESVFDSRVGVAWVRSWRWTILLVATRAVLALLGVVQVIGFNGDNLELTTPMRVAGVLLLVPVVWTYVWWPLHRGRMLVHVAVQQAMIHRDNTQVILAVIWYVVNHLLVVAAVSGVTFYVVALLNAAFGALDPVPNSWRFLGLWTFPVLILLYNHQVIRNARQDTVIRSRWDRVG